MQFEQMKRLSVIKECDEFKPRTAYNRFSSNKPVRKATKEKENQQSSHLDLLNRSNQEILHDYQTNPFFRAKLNYLFKSTPALSRFFPYQQRLNDLPIQSFKHSTRTANQELQIKLQQLALLIGEGRRA